MRRFIYRCTVCDYTTSLKYDDVLADHLCTAVGRPRWIPLKVVAIVDGGLRIVFDNLEKL